MKIERQTKILELIRENDIETQSELLEKLNAEGFSATQATVSRDIKELRLVKVPSSSGAYKYASETVSETIPGMLSETLSGNTEDTSVTDSFSGRTETFPLSAFLPHPPKIMLTARAETAAVLIESLNLIFHIRIAESYLEYIAYCAVVYGPVVINDISVINTGCLA